MSLRDSLVHAFYKATVSTVLSPVRNIVFNQVGRTKINQTERDALEAGTAGFEADILNGKPDWSNILDIEKPQLSKKEQEFLDGPVEELCNMLNDWEIRNSPNSDMPEEVWQFIKDNKFFGMVIPEEHGGLGFSALAQSEVVMKLSSRSTSAAVTVMVPNSLGPGELIERYGTKEQKETYLHRLASGKEIPCFALTESGAGSDAGGIQSHGVVCKNEKGELGIKLNINDKRYITLAPIATLAGVAFNLSDPDGLLVDKKDPNYKEDVGITVALVPRNTEGVEMGRRHIPLDVPFYNGTVNSKDAFIPIDNIIGGPKQAGKGWAMLMQCLAVGRSISLPANATGGSKLATLMSGTYSRTRRQFDMPISNFEGINTKLGQMAGTTYMMNAARTTTAQMIDAGGKPSVLGAVLKYHLTEKMRKVGNDAMDIHGGKGISLGPKNYLAAMYQATPIGITVEGANILTRNLMIFNQASMRSHNYLFDETEAAIGKDKKKFTDLMARHIRQSINNGVRTIWLGLTNAVFSKSPVKKSPGKKYYKHINRLSSALATMADTTYFAVGAAMKSKQDVTARLGDALSNLYLASTTLRYFEANGCKKEEEDMMHWACQQALADAETAMDELIDNYPVKFVRPILRPLIFPLSVIPFVSAKRFKGPSDELTHRAANAIIEPGPARDEIAKGIFVPKGKGEHIAEMMEAFNDTVKAAPIEDKILSAVKKKHKKDVPDNEKILSKTLSDRLNEAVEKGIITKDDILSLKKAETSRNAIIRVDDFSNDLSEVRGSRLNKSEASPANNNDAGSLNQTTNKPKQGGMKP
jgi:acyl-CoA dehydrogenase